MPCAREGRSPLVFLHRTNRAKPGLPRARDGSPQGRDPGIAEGDDGGPVHDGPVRVSGRARFHLLFAEDHRSALTAFNWH